MTDDPDQQLLRRFVTGGDAIAFDQIARRYRSMVFSTARRVTQSHHDAEDVAQGCFLELAKKASSIRISIPAFLHATATRRSIDLLRDHSRRRKYERKAATDRPEPVVEPHPAERSWDEISPEVDHAIDRLPDELKTIVILYFLRGLSVADIGVETGLKRGVIERRLQLGIRRLRADLSKGVRSVPVGVLAAGFKAAAAKSVPATLTAATGRMALAINWGAGTPVKGSRRPLTRVPLKPWPVWLIPAAVAGIALAVVFVGIKVRVIGPSAARVSVAVSPKSPYDRLALFYGNRPDNRLGTFDPAGFTAHVAALRNDPTSFWRGTQPLFFDWTRTHCADWYSGRSPRVLCQASPNLEDDLYFSAAADPDQSARLPVQIELLQGMIIARLATDGDRRADADRVDAEIAAALCDGYRSALAGQTPIRPAPVSGKINRDEGGNDPPLDGSGNFKSVVLDRQNKISEFLRPSPIPAETIEPLLADACGRSPVLGRFCRTDRPRVRQVRSVVRYDSVSTQGELMLLVQLETPGMILELKQRTPAAAELAGAVPADPRTPGRRAAEDAVALSPGIVPPVGWLDCGDLSFTVAPLGTESRVYELRKNLWTDPVDAARRWAIAAGEIHRGDPARAAVAAAITPELEPDLVSRSDAYLAAMKSDLHEFFADPRVARDRETRNALMTGWLRQSAVSAAEMP